METKTRTRKLTRTKGRRVEHGMIQRTLTMYTELWKWKNFYRVSRHSDGSITITPDLNYLYGILVTHQSTNQNPI
jgi:hypothetical protein